MPSEQNGGVTPVPDNPPATRPLASDAAYETLKRDILLCRLAPGSELREAALVSRLAVGRTPVREALNRLVHEDLVEVRPRKGYRVTEVTYAGVHEVFEMRAEIEPHIAALAAARAAPEQTALLTRCPGQDEGTHADRLTSDHDAHVQLAQLSGNRYLVRAMRHVLADLQRILVLSLGENLDDVDLPGYHERLSEALIAGDAAAARSAVTAENDHLRQLVLDSIVSVREEVPVPVSFPARRRGAIRPARALSD